MTVDPPREQRNFFEDIPVAGEKSGDVHHLAETAGKRLGDIAANLFRVEHRAGSFKRSGRHAGADLHAQIHAHASCRVEKIVDCARTGDVREFMRIADGGRDAARQNATLVLERSHHARFDMHVRVDESRNGEESRAIDLVFPLIPCTDPGDSVAADGDILPSDLAGGQIKHRDVFQHHGCGVFSLRLLDDRPGNIRLLTHFFLLKC